MITITRLGGQAVSMNPDLIERMSENPDTTIYLVDGSSIIVLEPMDEVVERIHDARADVLARAAKRRDDELLAVAAAETLERTRVVTE
ncbi:flagellar FlbD family protein [Gryllotalpicola sp.]|uniref:flagellar FlbD family protein n=1 Tax=Gryllotalpicola sp. TaxID=1932787 RepID=UPI0026071207|nr:flagellar FlbD family protein [Gryllotalpicola sp.]